MPRHRKTKIKKIRTIIPYVPICEHKYTQIGGIIKCDNCNTKAIAYLNPLEK